MPVKALIGLVLDAEILDKRLDESVGRERWKSTDKTKGMHARAM